MSRHVRPVFPCMLAGLLLCVLLHSSRIGVVSSAPICALHGHGGCHAPSLADMFDRVIQHSARMHSISNDLHSHFEQFFLPSRNRIHRVNRQCHTSTILTPSGKENAQRLTRGELTEVILRLLVAWRDPLWHLHQNMAHQDNSNSFSSDKALEMSDMVHELRRGVEKVARKMQNLGILGNSENSLVAPGALVPLSNNGEWRVMNDYDLLYCFRRDSDKVQNYLKILKCRIVPEHGC